MMKSLLNLKGAQELSKNEQKSTGGGFAPSGGCGGDGSFITVNGQIVCCYIPWSGHYRC
jgi:hypothetical protein